MKDEGMMEEDLEKLEQKRQTQVHFSTEASEVSFNDYIEKIKQKEKTCELQMQIDYHVKDQKNK